MSSNYIHPREIYEIQVQGKLDYDWQQWFNDLTITLESLAATWTGLR